MPRSGRFPCFKHRSGLWLPRNDASVLCLRPSVPFGSVAAAPKRERLGGTDLSYFPIAQAGDLARLPMTVKILLEQVLRTTGEAEARAAVALTAYPRRADISIPFRPTRILLQDYTGVPAAVDLAAMRSAMARAGNDPGKIEPLIPVHLLIDHPVQADFFGSKEVYERNLQPEY